MISRRPGFRFNRGRIAVGAAVPGGGGGDVTAPQLSGNPVIATDGLSIALLYNEALDTGSVPSAGAYSLAGTTSTIASVGIVGSTVTLTITSGMPIYGTETVTVSYTAGGAPVQDLAGNDAANLSGQATTNNSTAAADVVVLTRYSDLSSNFPTKPGNYTARGWGGGGGGTAAVSSGGSGAFAEKAGSYASAAAFTLAVGAAGTAPGGTGGDTTLDTTTVVAKGASGVTGGSSGSSVGDTVRAGQDGTTSGSGGNGAASPGSSTAASGTTPGDPDGSQGGMANGALSAKIPGGGGFATGVSQRNGAQGLGVLIYDEPADTAYPNLVGVAVTRTPSGTSHSITIPSGSVGDLLVYIVGSDGNPTITCGSDTSICSATNGTAVTGNAFLRVATGSDTTTITTSASESIDVVVLRFRSAGTPTGTATNSTGVNADPPSHTPAGGSAPYRWITVAIVDNTTTNGNITGRPTNYNRSVLVPPATASGGVAMLVTWRDATAASEDPGAFTSESGGNVTMTISVPHS